MKSKILFMLIAFGLFANLKAIAKTNVLSDSVTYTDIQLSSVKKNTAKNLPIGKIQVFKKHSFVYSIYEDKYIKIIFNGSTPQAHFILNNKTQSSIKLIWNDVVYIADGEQNSIIHNGQSQVDFEKEKKSVTIMDGARLTEQVWPKVSYEWGYMWAHKGSKVRVVLPLQINGRVIEYSFYFDVIYFDGKRSDRKDYPDRDRWIAYYK